MTHLDQYEPAVVRAWEIAGRLILRAADRIKASTPKGSAYERYLLDLVGALDSIGDGLFFDASQATPIYPLAKRPRRGCKEEC